MAYLSVGNPLSDRLDDDDDGTADLIAKLQLRYLGLSGSSVAGKGRSGEFTDESHALQLQQQELENDDLPFSNGSMAQSSDYAQSHVPTVLNTTSQANIAGGDRDLAQTPKEHAGLPYSKDFKASLGSRIL